jgi:hypothetical protein
MATRGPKLRSAKNAGRGRSGLIRRESLSPPSDLTEAAQAEYGRLCDVLESRGTLDRVDLAVLAEAARIKALLDRAHAVVDVSDGHSIKVVNLLTTQRRGLLRELGLTLMPSRSLVRTNASNSEKKEADPLGELIRLHG